MSKREPRVYLLDILDSIEQIREYLEGVTLEEFSQQRLRQDGVVRQLEIIGEASRLIPAEIKQAHPEIAWDKIVGMRHRITHAYFQVDLEVVWETARDDLPQLKSQVQAMLESM